MEFHIREVTEADYDDLQNLFSESLLFHHTALPGMFRRPDEATLAGASICEAVEGEDLAILVADYDGELVGCVCVYSRSEPGGALMAPRRYALMDNLIVTELFRHRGVASLLMTAAEQWAKEHDLDEAQLSVWEFNTGARELYGKLGYKTIARIMVKELE